MWAQEAQEEQAALLLATKGIVGIQGKASKNTENQTLVSSALLIFFLKSFSLIRSPCCASPLIFQLSLYEHVLNYLPN